MLFAFALNSYVARLLWKLGPVDHSYILYSNNFEHYKQQLLHGKPLYVLGLGTYTGVDQKSIKIETITRNQFRNDPIDANLPYKFEREIRPYLQPISQKIEYAESIGNSWCNLVSWKIVEMIESKQLQSQYTFIHIPKFFKLEEAIELIEVMIEKR